MDHGMFFSYKTTTIQPCITIYVTVNIECIIPFMVSCTKHFCNRN